MLNKTIVPLLCLIQLALSPCLNAQNWIQVQTPPSWQQVKEAQNLPNNIRMLGTYTIASPDLFAIVITTPLGPVDYATARDFVESTEQGYEVQKLEVAKPYPTHQMELPGMAIGAYGNNLHNLSLCLFTTDQAIQLNFYCSQPISPESPRIQQFIQGIKLAPSVQAASLTQQDLDKMTQPELKPERIRLYAGIGAAVLLILFMLIRIVRRSNA